MKRAVAQYLPVVVVAALIAVMGVLLCGYEDALLYRAQECDLFLPTGLFFRQSLVVPGGLLSYVGSFFTQFFFHPALGTLWLCLWWALLTALTSWAFRLPRRVAVVAVLPAVLLLSAVVGTGYWVYLLKLRGHLFVATVGTTAAVFAAGCYRALADRWWMRTLMALIVGLTAYPLLGAYGLLAEMLIVATAWRLAGRRLNRRLTDTLLMAVAIVAVPLLSYRHLFHETPSADLYRAALPRFTFVDVSEPGRYLPYILLALVLLLATLLPWRRLTARGRGLHWALFNVAIVAVMALFVRGQWVTDANLHRELAMQRCMEASDWAGLLTVARTQGDDEPTRAIVMMRNLALQRLGRQSSDMLRYPEGDALPASGVGCPIAETVGRQLYFNYGQLNYCFRWCMEDGVERGWQVEHLKLMALCSLLNGESRLASKYVALLRQTRYHRQWAEAVAQLIRGGAPAVTSDRRLQAVVSLMPETDHLGNDAENIEWYLLSHFASDADSASPQRREAALLAVLLMKDRDRFWPQFMRYVDTHPGIAMPRLFQEAAYLHGQHRDSQVDVSAMPFDADIPQLYERFMRAAYDVSSLPASEQQARLRPQFGHTYFYYFFHSGDLFTN